MNDYKAANENTVCQPSLTVRIQIVCPISVSLLINLYTYAAIFF